MKSFRLIACVAATSLLLAACSRDDQPAKSQVDVSAPMTDAGTPAPAPAAAIDSGLIELVTAQDGQQPLAMSAGQTVSGEFVAPKAGKLTAVSLFIGNYVSTSDGELKVEICQSSKCADGTADVAGSQDNAYLEIKLAHELELTSGAATYRVTKIGGANVVAMWTYPPNDTMTSIKSADGSSLPRAPRIALRYAP